MNSKNAESSSWSSYWILWIVIIIAAIYSPFLGQRVIRMAGDEKVYVSQAIEMAQHGRWFIQTLQGAPDYYKGPLHYILIRLGMMVFGWNTWAVLYMNLALVIGGACALGNLVRKYCGGTQANGLAVWTGVFFAVCTGVYTHSFASQMEAELAGLFAIALYLLDRVVIADGGFLFWTMVGLMGWSKSPLHAALAGSAALLFWLVNGELLVRMKNWKSWAAVFLGIAFCTAGYAPAYLLDRENFVNIYLIRETLDKGDSGQSWTISFQSVLGFYLFPWALLAFIAYGDFLFKIARPWKYFFDPKIRRGLSLAICGVTPSFLFFALHPYHFENYDLPVIAGVILFVSIVFSTRNLFTEKLYRLAAVITAILFLGVPIGLTVLAQHFAPLPAWWPSWLVPLAWISCTVSFTMLVWFAGIKKFARLEWVAASLVGFFLATGSIISVIGERELYDLRAFLSTTDTPEIGYYNLQHNIWSEWGLLNFWIHRKVTGLHEPAQLKEALLSGAVVLIPARTEEDFKNFLAKEIPDTKFNFKPWRRWRTQGKTESGQPLWKEAWDRKDFSVLEANYLIVWRTNSSNL